MASLKIAQTNLGRSRLASEELLVSAVGEGFDVLLIQEPYVYGGQAWALGSFSRVVITGQKRDETPWATVVVLSPSITATHLAAVLVSSLCLRGAVRCLWVCACD
ncbi:hypothetical protein TKK_0016674 [Trichogramma kaykai]|uniref:Endonuclease/exonuclease/phosphatase domain-containing protein n=1 Tax=Trichogramma kaykai TaxID=54128 RepID=A0ABD2W672_9HYME